MNTEVMEGAITLDYLKELAATGFADPKNRRRLKEITRLREALLDYFVGSNQYGSSPEIWHSCFHAYGMGAAPARQAAPA